MSKLLIVIDMQNDFISGSLGRKAAEVIVPAVANKVNKYFENKDSVIYTQDTHDKNYFNTLEGKKLPIEHCIYETEGWNIDSRVMPQTNEAVNVIKKKTFGYYDWEEYFMFSFAHNEDDNIEEIEICGLCTDICVVSNALILRALFPNVVIKCDSSCCAGTSDEAHEAALRVMRSCQIEVY